MDETERMRVRLRVAKVHEGSVIGVKYGRQSRG